MGKKTKKVVFFIVEGTTEETAFSTIFKGIFQNERILFCVMQGDITSNWNTRGNIVHEVYARIKNEMNRYGYQKRDILKVFHLIDTDGAFISDDYVHFHSGEDVIYTLEEIFCPSIEKILDRNKRKKNAVIQLKSRSAIGKIPYRMLFLSRNMEHVLYDRMDSMSRDEKVQLADSFSDCYSFDMKGFKKLICSKDFAVEGTYADTWKFIMKDRNSLKRYSNLHLILEEEEIQKEHDSTEKRRT